MSGINAWSLVGDDGISTEDFRFDERGRLVQDTSVVTAMVCALNQRLGAWWANPAHGSRILELLAGTPDPEPATALEATTYQALAPLESARRITDVHVQVRLDGNRAHIAVTARDVASGRPVTTEVITP